MIFTFNLPVEAGAPVISPLLESTRMLAGSPVALKPVGQLRAVIW
jgi:hypothetical protein